MSSLSPTCHKDHSNLLFVPDSFAHLGKDEPSLKSRTDQEEPGEEGDEYGGEDDDAVDDTLDCSDLPLQLGGRHEVHHDGADDGQTAGGEEDEQEDLHHLGLADLVVDVGLDRG